MWPDADGAPADFTERETKVWAMAYSNSSRLRAMLGVTPLASNIFYSGEDLTPLLFLYLFPLVLFPTKE